MKNTKTMMLLLIAGTVTFSMGLWAYSTMEPLGSIEYTTAVAVLAIVAFSLYFGVRRLRDQKKGLTVDDEMSRLIKQKAAASAFAASFYIWTMVLVFLVDTDIPGRYFIYIAVLGQGLLFVGFWLYYSRIGIQDENQD
jgi:uncharacterized membrane protein YiaA